MNVFWSIGSKILCAIGFPGGNLVKTSDMPGIKLKSKVAEYENACKCLEIPKNSLFSKINPTNKAINVNRPKRWARLNPPLLKINKDVAAEIPVKKIYILPE